MPRKPQFGSIYQPVKTLPDGSKVKTRVWWIRFYHNGKQNHESSKSRKYTDAQRLLKTRIAEIETGIYAGRRAEKVLVSELLDDLIEDYEANGKVADRVRYADKRLRVFFGNLRAARLETAKLKAYLRQRREGGVSNATINREMALLKRAFNLGRHATPPKVKRLPVWVPKLEEAAPRKGFFEHDEFIALRQEMPEYLRPPITFAYYTGCRRGEILRLEWLQVDLLNKTVRLNPGETKNKDGRVIPLFGELHEMLVMQKQIRDQKYPACPWVFFRYGKQIRDLRGAWAEASKRAATRKEKPAPSLWDAEAEKPVKLFHDLRRTGARNLVRAGVPERWSCRLAAGRQGTCSTATILSVSAIYTTLQPSWSGTSPKLNPTAVRQLRGNYPKKLN